MKLTLKSKRIILRPPKLSDAPILEKYINDRLVSRYLRSVGYPYPKGGMIKWIKRVQRRIKNKKGYNFIIVFDEKPIGSVGLGEIDWQNKNAKLGYWLARKFWGQGIMTEAVKLILDFGFRKLKLHRIEADAFKENKKSQRVLEKSGFKIEGISRESIFKFGRYHNGLRYGILVSDYIRNSRH